MKTGTEIEDPNDADGDSIPDFSDPSIVQVSSGNGVYRQAVGVIMLGLGFTVTL